ncbi:MULTISPECIES: ABC transporter permease [Thermaerobacter]|uniref:ABC transporter permease n=1 Tax=Thermaerobacter composti TaxID=554949 RepID=A0ABZ0QKZ0_9FIRM|nr:MULTISPECIES: ABC transporter permease [Thermaerobacter]QBS38077.1 ABC transporter permease [Thermaerobacter sp. FW80]WPD18096.1 ABC transporter permease [Thermaerobacter composti]
MPAPDGTAALLAGLLTLLAGTLRLSLPVLITSVGATFTELGGVVNIGLEGMMLGGAFASAWAGTAWGPAAGIAAGIAAGGLLALVHALAAVRFRVDHIVSGVAVNLLAAGLVRIGSYQAFGTATTSGRVEGLPPLQVPYLGQVSPLVVVGFLLVLGAWYVQQRTPFGLRLRACGENPLAADTLGVNVESLRMAGVILSGMMAGLAGSYLVVELNHVYVEGMTQGRGYVALAAMIFGNWTPAGAALASLLFGAAEALSIQANVAIPYQFLEMVPYVVTLLVLAGVVRRSTPPAAVGTHYSRDDD